ncbi:MAG TPA: HAD hydrolase-like protein [Acidimicrobiia bacterium]
MVEKYTRGATARDNLHDLDICTYAFDLDMTLVDSRPGVVASFAALTAETGVYVDGELVCSRLGPKLEDELANWFPPERIEAAAAAYRRHYDRECRTGTIALPGALALVEAVHERDGRAGVVTAKSTVSAHICLETVGLVCDEVAGWCFGAEKTTALRRMNADLYVGDTITDIAAGRAAPGVATVGVTTGPDDRDSLLAAGADIVISDLTEGVDAFAHLGRW